MRWFVAGILLTVGLVWFIGRPVCACTYKETAYMAAVRADLRVFSQAQEDFFADSGRYSADAALLGFPVTTNVSIAVQSATESTWSAIGIHRRASGWCVMSVGPSPLPDVDPGDGESACRWVAKGNERSRGLGDPE